MKFENTYYVSLPYQRTTNTKNHTEAEEIRRHWRFRPALNYPSKEASYAEGQNKTYTISQSIGYASVALSIFIIN